MRKILLLLTVLLTVAKPATVNLGNDIVITSDNDLIDTTLSEEYTYFNSEYIQMKKIVVVNDKTDSIDDDQQSHYNKVDIFRYIALDSVEEAGTPDTEESTSDKNTKYIDTIDHKIDRASTMIKNNDDLNLFTSKVRQKRDVSGSCAALNEKYRKDRRPEHLRLQMRGRPRRVTVMSTWRAPSRATAALLAAAIKYRAGYVDVTTIIDNRTVSQLAATVQPYTVREDFTDDELFIHVDAVVDQEDGPAVPRCVPGSYVCSIAGPRLQDMKRTPSIKTNLYVVLSSEVVNDTDCTDADNWLFYQNYTALQKCGLLHLPSSNTSSGCIPFLTVPEMQTNLKLKSNIFRKIPICEGVTTRIELEQWLRQRNSSFLFIDYDLAYERDNRIRIVEIPSRLSPTAPTNALRVADQNIFQHFAPKILDILNTTMPQPEDLREILLKNAISNNIDESACDWANENSAKFENWTKTSEIEPWFVTIICKDHSDIEKYYNAKNIISEILNEDLKEFKHKILFHPMSCNDDKEIGDWLMQIKGRSDYKSIAGIAAPAVGAEAVARAAAKIETQVIFYDVPSSQTYLNTTTCTISGGLQLLARSILYFFQRQKWERIAVISEFSSVAQSITAEFKSYELLIKEEKLDKDSHNKISKEHIQDILLRLQEADARIFFVNARSELATDIICLAADLNMTNAAKYAWIVRERPMHVCNSTVQVFSISYWWHGGQNDSLVNDFGGNAKIRRKFNEKWSGSSWPILAVPLADTLMLLAYRLQAMARIHPEVLYDFHGPGTTRKLAGQLIGNESIAGVVQKIQQSNFRQHDPLVFVTSWRDNIDNPITIWRAKSDTNDIIEIFPLAEAYHGGNRPNDGQSRCMTTTSGDPFRPSCHTAYWLCGILVSVILAMVSWRFQHERSKQNKKRQRETLMRLLSRSERSAALLEPYLVDRSALEFYDELGSGHFGRVHSGMLRLSGHRPVFVAVKTLRNEATPAEEAEFLREGSIMATLSHDHIVKLVGVCADADGLPQLLMEHAIFSDLLSYLRRRKHLAEFGDRDLPLKFVEEDSADPEARYVTPMELTRMAREAAAALDYLGTCHLLHRDIRAANCLVDGRRSLKLADFGMARSVNEKSRTSEEEAAPDDYKYICCRRGVFPVPWMAPESLEKGEFSRASDVWSLGVLILEIATLGARPYGQMTPLQVLRYVKNKGRPRLPIDASYHTCEVAEMCWSEIPSERATAKEVYEYLVNCPRALRAALKPAWPEDCMPEGSDSGFGEREEEWVKTADLRVSIS